MKKRLSQFLNVFRYTNRAENAKGISLAKPKIFLSHSFLQEIDEKPGTYIFHPILKIFYSTDVIKSCIIQLLEKL